MSFVGIRAAITWGWKPVAIGAVIGLYGNWQYHRGFDTGADSAICAFAVGLDGAAAIKTMEACRNITNHNWIVEGFDPHGKRAKA